MKIKLTEHMDWTESAWWIEDNKESMLKCKKLIIDFSKLCFITNNLIGFIIHIRSERKKMNLKTEIIPTQGILLKEVFRKILEG